jgi:hypothetical protein
MVFTTLEGIVVLEVSNFFQVSAWLIMLAERIAEVISIVFIVISIFEFALI